MKNKFLALSIVLMLIIVLAGCSNDVSSVSDNKINMPSSSKKFEGVNYQEVVTQLKDAGFTNIETEVLSDLVTGWTTRDGEVEKVSVDGDDLFSTDDKFPIDANIVVTYHTFPDDSSNEKREPEQSKEPVEEPIIKDETLTIDNCEELKSVLQLEDPADPSVKEFADKFKGQTIEFDGRIDYVTQHENYKTRYDLLMSYGDYDENTQMGPTFQFSDVGLQELGIKDLYLPAFVKVGSNVKIVAEVKTYNEDSGLFILKPVSIQER